MTSSFDASIEADLDEYLDIEVPLGEPPDYDDTLEPPVLPAPDDLFADRLLYKGRRLTEEAKAVRDLAAKRRAEIDAWEADRVSGIGRELDRVERSLGMFMRLWHQAHPRSKSLKLSNGTLKLSNGRGRLVVTDEYAFTAWAQEHGREDLLIYKPSPAKKELADEGKVARHQGVQQTIENSKGKPELCQTWRLMADVLVTPEDGPASTEKVSVPGAVYAEPVEDRFAMILAGDNEQEDEDQ